MPRRKGTPGAAIGVPQMKTPEFPPLLRWRQSTSRMKFSYWRVVLMAPVGFPVQWIRPSFTVQVSGAQLAFTQPFRSCPLKREMKPSSTAPKAVKVAVSRRREQSRCMCEGCQQGLANARQKEPGGEWVVFGSGHLKSDMREEGSRRIQT